MTLLQLTRADLSPILSAHTGNKAFAEAWSKAVDPSTILYVLGNYTYFNSVFGGGVANLAGEIAVRHDLFRDSTEPVRILADRSSDVAAAIFFAAIDEFGDRSTKNQDIHRTLSQATLKATGNFYGFHGDALAAVTTPNATTLSTMNDVVAGYGLGRSMGQQELFRAMGFHAASEILADEEFRLLDTHLRSVNPDLVDYLKSNKVEIGGLERDAYIWIYIHTSVEADHFAYAMKGANTALQFYCGDVAPEEARGWVLDGFTDFANVQTRFMEQLQV